MALPLAWLAGVALQLRERELMPLAAYVVLAAIALVAIVMLVMRSASRRYLVVIAAGALDVAALSSSLEDDHPLLAPASHQQRCAAGQRWTWDGVDFAVHHPAADDYDRAAKPNAMSCVLRISDAGRSVLLTGDIEREQEAALVAGQREALRSDVLVVPHHGSKTSSSAPFLDAVRPAVAVFQAGCRIRFGHPAAEVLDRYRERAIAIVASPTCGAWQWRADGPPGGTCQRETGGRYWHHPGLPIDP